MSQPAAEAQRQPRSGAKQTDAPLLLWTRLTQECLPRANNGDANMIAVTHWAQHIDMVSSPLSAPPSSAPPSSAPPAPFRLPRRIDWTAWFTKPASSMGEVTLLVFLSSYATCKRTPSGTVERKFDGTLLLTYFKSVYPELLRVANQRRIHNIRPGDGSDYTTMRILVSLNVIKYVRACSEWQFTAIGKYIYHALRVIDNTPAFVNGRHSAFAAASKLHTSAIDVMPALLEDGVLHIPASAGELTLTPDEFLLHRGSVAKKPNMICAT